MFRIRFRIRFPCWLASWIYLVLTLLPIILLGTLIASRARASAPDSPSALSATLGLRQYYLSRSYVQAHEAPSACASGYHFASIWEIADPSALKYNAGLGLFSPDGGDGPPTTINLLGNPYTARGWVRTGFAFSTSDTPGQANCGTWLSNNSFYWGTTANLPSNWTGGEQDIGVWDVGVATCNTHRWVWCVQDDSVLRVFLPLVLRD